MKLPKGDYREIIFAEADLSNADLRGSNFVMADFTIANLSEANLSEARLECARFRQAELYRAKLRKADLTFADFSGADMDHTDVTGATFGHTVLAWNDLSTVIGLDSVEHDGPSSIGVDTIYLSKGRIPESFLQGCGVPESLINYIPSLLNSEDGIQFYSCFISYSTKDEEFARRLHGRMRDAHLRVWFAPEDMKSGQKLHEQIDTAIRVYDKLLIVLSEASLQSEWVMTELRKARKAGRQSGQRKLVPVRLVDMETLRDWECFDADSGKNLATELREYFIPDFSHWNEHAPFEAAFARLLKDLRAEDRAK